jgi:hypothetical protein
MFLNNASSLATRTPRVIHSNNENAATALRATKSLASDNNNLTTKTPKTIGKETQQRRRRALGDISNRKGSLGTTNNNTNKNGGISVKKQQKQVNFATTPFTKQGASITNNALSKSLKQSPLIHIEPIQEKEPEHDYDLVLGRTTRWSTAEEQGKNRSPFDVVSKDELFLVDTVLEEIDAKRRQKEKEEQRRMEMLYEEKLREASRDGWDAGLEGVGLDDGGWVEDESSYGLIFKEDEWDEEEDGDDLLNLLEELDFDSL